MTTDATGEAIGAMSTWASESTRKTAATTTSVRGGTAGRGSDGLTNAKGRAARLLDHQPTG